MVDTHYDLLSICYKCYLLNDYSLIKKYSKEIISSGVKCIFANLYFMSEKEMANELHPNYYDKNVSVLQMFRISKKILLEYLPNVDFIFSIEGCDYIKIDELEDLYNEGLKSILLVWNNENIYGSGIRTHKHLTKLGKNFLNKAIELGIGIDLSHANEETFYDMIDVIKENIKNNKKVICYASHSNSRTLCNIERNLTDKQLKSIRSVNGYVGVISNVHFINSKDNSFKSKSKEYLKHIIYISKIVGKDKVMLSTDDMRFYSDYDKNYLCVPIYEYANIKSEIEEELLTFFNKVDSENILSNNGYQIYNELTKSIRS